MLKRPLLRISLSLCFFVVFSGSASCQRLPAFPEVWQCGVRFSQLFCVNNRTGEERVYSVNDEEVQGSQCYLPDDYLEVERWITEIKREARKRCNGN